MTSEPVERPDTPALDIDIVTWDEKACREAARLRRKGPGEEVVRSVRNIVEDVATRKDAAVREWTQRFDGAGGEDFSLEAAPEEFEAAYRLISGPVLEALRRAIARVRKYQEDNLWVGRRPRPEPGPDQGTAATRASLEARPLDRVGIYIPGGRAAYPSSVVMTAIPARVAGVGEVIVCTPPDKDGRLPALTLVACRECGVDRVFKVGGAQAVAALAYGTETIPAVDKIVGPGNAYVTEAKRQVFGLVGIDSLAGPSEVLVLAGTGADPETVATDLLAQAEHGPGALGLLVTWDQGLTGAVRQKLGELAPKVSRQVKGQVALCTVASATAAVDLSTAWHAEHVEVFSELPADLLLRVRGAAIFAGPATPVAFGDYVAGPSHVLPTMGAGRFSGPLSANDFFRTYSYLQVDSADVAVLATDTGLLAWAEGLPWHARSAARRGRLSAQDRGD